MTRKALSWEDFKKVMNEVDKNHRFGRGGKSIKYVDPIIDMRTRDIFNVTFRGSDGERTFHIVNENRDKDLYEMIMDYLNSPNIENEEEVAVSDYQEYLELELDTANKALVETEFFLKGSMIDSQRKMMEGALAKTQKYIVDLESQLENHKNKTS